MRSYVPLTIAAGLIAFQPQVADACGLKLSKKAIKVSDPIRPSSNPARILVAGGAPRSLSKVLGQAGHIVESTDNLEDVRGKDYNVVLVENAELGKKAKDFWPNADILAISDRTRANLVAVEKVRRRDGAGGGTLVAAAERRQPVATGPAAAQDDDANRRLVAAGPTDSEKLAANDNPTPPAEETTVVEDEEAPAPKQEEKPVLAARAETPKPEPKPAVVKKEEPKPVLAKVDVAPRAEEDEEDEVEEKPVKRTRAEKAERSERAPVARPDKNEVAFFAASARLIGEHRRLLDQYAKWLKQNPDVTITIEGHASTDGAREFNQRISERRARAVMQYLLKRGVPSSRMESVGYGEDRPKYEPSDSPENRRAEIVVKE